MTLEHRALRHTELVHIYDALGLRGGNPRFATRGWMIAFAVLFGVLLVAAAGWTVQAAVDRDWRALVFYGLSTALLVVLVTFAASELRGLRAGAASTD